MIEVSQIVDVLNQVNKRALLKMGLGTDDFRMERLINITEINHGLIRMRFKALRQDGKKYIEAVEIIAQEQKCSDDYIKKIVSILFCI